MSAVGASACGLVLGIDDIPAVQGVADAGVKDAREAGDVRADVVDAKRDRSVDARPDQGVDAPGHEVGPVGQLPARSGPQSTSDAAINFALHQMWVGDTDKDSAFTPDLSAWATFGYNIDGKVTTSSSTDVCTLSSNAEPTAQVDGLNGADNSFGENLVGGLSLLFQGLSLDLTTRIESGAFTILIDTTGLSPSPVQTNVGLTTSMLAGARFSGTPTFTLADNWPVNPSTLADGVSLANGAKISISDSYVTGGTFVSGHPSDFGFTIQVSNQPFLLIMHQAVTTFQHTVDDAGANHAVNGMVAGVLKASEVISALKGVAAGSSHGQYCPIVASLAERILAAQDIMEDGTNTPGQPCNGISIALAFTADEIQPPSQVAPQSYSDGSVPQCPVDGGDAGDAAP